MKQWMFYRRNVWEKVESQIFEKKSQERVRSGKYLGEKLKAWKEEITTNCSCSKLSSQ